MPPLSPAGPEVSLPLSMFVHFLAILILTLWYETALEPWDFALHLTYNLEVF